MKDSKANELNELVNKASDLVVNLSDANHNLYGLVYKTNPSAKSICGEIHTMLGDLVGVISDMMILIREE